MAKFGEGDPRWIVNDRPDGANVNSWHWEEKDLTKSVHEALKELVKDKKVVGANSASLKLTEISEIDGDVTVAQRKGKIMCYFEIKCTVKWIGTINEKGEKNVEGKLTCPEVDHDTFRDDFPINVSVMEHNNVSAMAESIMQKDGRKLLRSLISGYFENLFKEYSVGAKMINGASGMNLSSPTVNSTTITQQKPATAPAVNYQDNNERTNISWVLCWGVPPQEIFSAFIDERRVSMYHRCLAHIDPRPDGQFSFMDGAMSGHFVEIKPNERIVMQWKLPSWTVMSTVVMEFKKEEAYVTRMSFAQAGIPIGDYKRVKYGWKERFLEPIKMILGFPLTWIEPAQFE